MAGEEKFGYFCFSEEKMGVWAVDVFGWSCVWGGENWLLAKLLLPLYFKNEMKCKCTEFFMVDIVYVYCIYFILCHRFYPLIGHPSFLAGRGSDVPIFCMCWINRGSFVWADAPMAALPLPFVLCLFPSPRVGTPAWRRCTDAWPAGSPTAALMANPRLGGGPVSAPCWI